MAIHNSVNGIIELRAIPKEAIYKGIMGRLNWENIWILVPSVSVVLVCIIIYQLLEFCWPESILKLRKLLAIMMYSGLARTFLIVDLALALYGIQCFKYFATVTEEDMKENATFKRIKIQQLIVFLGLIAGNIFI